MNQELARHERVRFRRDEIVRLDALPSGGGEPPLAPQRPRGRGRRTIGLALLGVFAVLILLAGAGYFYATSGPGGERLRQQAEAAIRSIANADVDVASGRASLSLSSLDRLSVEIPDIRLTDRLTGRPFAELGAVRVRAEILPLLGGRLRLGGLGIADARIVTHSVPQGERRDWTVQFRSPEGLIEPDLVAAGLFEGLNRAFAALDRQSVRNLWLDNVDIVLGDDGLFRHLRIIDAVARRETAHRMTFEGDLELDGRPIRIDAQIERDGQNGRIAGLSLEAAVAPFETAPVTDDGPASEAVEAAAAGLQGAFDLVLTGAQSETRDQSELRASLTITDGRFAVPQSEGFRGDASVSLFHSAGSGKIEIESLSVAAERSQLDFHGAIGPAPAGSAETPAYRFEFVSDRSTLAMPDSPEPALPLFARLAGTYQPEERDLFIREIGVRTGPGEVMGQARIGFEPGLAPSVALALDVPNMPVSHAKQIWPQTAARGARRWVQQNVFGGRLVTSNLRLRVPAGRLGNGVPLDAEEVSGRFVVEDTRFDMAGDLPPVRDAYGVVTFQGAAVDIELSSGSVFLPSGRTVAARNGTFSIREPHVRPVIGSLKLDVEGDAPSVIEFASYRPIEANRSIDLGPDEISGDVSGRVIADIPLQQVDFPADRLSFDVALNYRNLAISRPFEGQRVTAAEGTIRVDRAKAVIEAKAQLNGMPAEITMTEPLGDASPARRERRITLSLDDKGRAALAPGLNTLISGPARVTLEQEAGGQQTYSADLTAGTIMLPWIGWSKGPGVEAKATFKLANDGGTTRISDFALDGRSFSARGDITLSGGALSSAQFSRVALNRGDAARVSIRREGRGYAIDARGESFDARSTVKLYLSETEKAEGAVEATPISLTARFDRLTGFKDEALSGVSIAYKGTGIDAADLSITASTRNGAPFSVTNASRNGSRELRMQSTDAGSVVRFLDLYEYMRGGAIDLALSGASGQPLRGAINARNFQIVNEPRLRSIVSSAPPQGDGRSLNQAVRRDIDVSVAEFERGFAMIEKGRGYLSLDRGVLRGPLIGASFQGTLYDANHRMAMTGTFMPAYGLNRLFAEIPLVGQILGNGRDRGLIGITFRLAGEAKAPQLQINPISVIAPGIFRSIFEFN